MNMVDVSSGNSGANSIVEDDIPTAVGGGSGLKMQEMNRVLLSYFSDG